MKKLLSLLLCVLMVVSFAACGGETDKTDKTSKPTGTKVDSSLKKGEIAPVGDVFELPSVEQAQGAPVLAEITKQAYPGDSIMVSGEGFSGAGVKFYVYSQSTKDNGKAIEAKFTVADDNYASVLIDESLEYGMYAIYAENASGKSNVKTVNKPAIWDIGLYKLTAGETLTILGENLTTDNGDKTSAFLVSEDGKEYCEASVSFADPGKVDIIIPENLKVGSKYKVRIHNGHGGNEGFAESTGMVEILKESAIQFAGKIFDVTDYKADPSSRSNDDTKAVSDIVKEAKSGDTIYFPAGSYLITQTVAIREGVRIVGAGIGKTTIYVGYDIENGAFELSGEPCEVTGITFEQNRLKGKCKTALITYKGNTIETGAYKFYVHDCEFNQYVNPKKRSYKQPIAVNSTYGVRIENNRFDGFGVVAAHGCVQVSCKNNEAYVSTYVGIYYGTASVFFTNTEFLDISNNIVCGKGATVDSKSGALNNDEFTAGRVFVIQGHATNTYISHNKVVRAGVTDTNAGEIILFEQYSFLYEGTIAEKKGEEYALSTSTRNKTVVGSVITINDGKGKGQYRTIVNRRGALIKIDRPWDIEPDTTSEVIITRCYLNATVCDNYIDAYENWAERPSSATGIQVYGSTHNMFYCRNKLKNVMEAATLSAFYSHDKTDAGSIAVIAWNQFDRNVCENAGNGITATMGVPVDEGEIPGEICFANTIRKNEFSNIRDFTKAGKVGTGGEGIQVGVGSRIWQGEWCAANLFENNTMKSVASADILLGVHQGKNLFRNNTKDSAKAAYQNDGVKPPIEIAY